jgi:hypothetical protein
MRVLASVTYWLYADELIGHADAARLLYGESSPAHLARVRRMVERGELDHYWRPGREDNRGRAVLVRRSAVEHVKQEQEHHNEPA